MTHRPRALLCGLAALIVAGLGIATVARTPDAGQAPVPVIVELFTSEGCSSCPPADQLLIELTEKQPIQGALVIGLGEHVDYWDRQGWKDPFSDAAFTQRQTAYAAVAGTNDIYTPQMIIDGVDAIVGHDRTAAFASIKRAAAAGKSDLRLVWTSPTLTVAITRRPATANATVFLAITEDGLQTSVKRGENAGRTLAHAAVTRRLTRLGKIAGDGAFDASVPVVLDPTWRRDALRLVVFVQTEGPRRILVAAAIGA